jgi:hypothetical protein
MENLAPNSPIVDYGEIYWWHDRRTNSIKLGRTRVSAEGRKLDYSAEYGLEAGDLFTHRVPLDILNEVEAEMHNRLEKRFARPPAQWNNPRELFFLHGEDFAVADAFIREHLPDVVKLNGIGRVMTIKKVSPAEREAMVRRAAEMEAQAEDEAEQAEMQRERDRQLFIETKRAAKERLAVQRKEREERAAYIAANKPAWEAVIAKLTAARLNAIARLREDLASARADLGRCPKHAIARFLDGTYDRLVKHIAYLESELKRLGDNADLGAFRQDA